MGVSPDTKIKSWEEMEAEAVEVKTEVAEAVAEPVAEEAKADCCAGCPGCGKKAE